MINNNFSDCTFEGLLTITKRGGVSTLSGCKNATQDLSDFSELPVWEDWQISEYQKGKVNPSFMCINTVTVLKHVKQFDPSISSLRQQFPNAKKDRVFTQEERFIAAILDWAHDTFQFLKGVSFQFQSTDGQYTLKGEYSTEKRFMVI